MLRTDPYSVDTNIILRSIEPKHPMHAIAKNAVARLTAQGTVLYLFPQNVREFWNVATRPSDRNGLGMTHAEVELAVQQLESAFTILGDGLATYQIWRGLVFQHQVSGVQVHDCYIAAAMKVHGIQNLLTFNTTDFVRYGITAVDPVTV